MSPSRATRRITWVLLALVGIAFVVYVANEGFPASRDRLFLWLLAFLVVASLREPSTGVAGVLIQWLPFAAILLTYDLLRGIADGLLFPSHVLPQLRADEFLFGGVAPTVWLQNHLWHPDHIHWYDYGTWAVYLTHFFGTLLVAVGIWIFARQRFRRYVVMVSLLAAIGFLTYTLYPAAPPWLAGQTGALPRVDRIIASVWGQLDIVNLDAVFEHGQRYVNNVAAVPSLHAAYSLLITLFLWPLARNRWPRSLLAVYPLLMGFALVYSGEHYAVDIFLGWLYAAVVFWGVNALADRRSASRAGSSPAA